MAAPTAPDFDPLLTETVDELNIDETAPPQKSPLRAALPFAGRGPEPPPAPSGEETAPPQKSPLAAALPFRHMPTPEDLSRLAPGRPAPGAAPSPKNTASAQGEPFGLSIERYASLCAELAVFPQAAEATFTKYGLAAWHDRVAADAAWQERLRADEALMARWQGLYLHYHEQLSRAGRP